LATVFKYHSATQPEEPELLSNTAPRKQGQGLTGLRVLAAKQRCKEVSFLVLKACSADRIHATHLFIVLMKRGMKLRTTKWS